VRELASRSANAAKEIKTLISTSSDQVANGVSLVNRTGDALSLIEGQVGAVAGLIDEIVTGAEEQTSAIGSINVSVNTMDQATQQNAAMAEETSTACKALNGEAQSLEAVVRRFRAGSGVAERVSRAA
jgi:methyl-accepting chemotaxis protein